MVRGEGFEPSTNWLKANCSTAELPALMGADEVAIFETQASLNMLQFRLFPPKFALSALLKRWKGNLDRKQPCLKRFIPPDQQSTFQ